jgi:hypothetical protein
MTMQGLAPRAETRPEIGAPLPHRPRTVPLLVVLLGLLAVGGLYGGLSFVIDKTGASLGARLSWLDRTPVSDFLLPGLFLLAVYGLGGLLLIGGLIWRFSPGPMRRLDRALGHHWAWAGSIALGSVLVAWIVYELIVMPATMILQPILIIVGLAIASVPLLHPLRSWYRIP